VLEDPLLQQAAMTDVKQLLERATPLPWSVGKSVHHDGHNLWQTDTQGDITSPNAHLSPEDAALIVYSVNRLPDYEVAVDALERLCDAAEGHEHQHLDGPDCVPAVAVADIRAALRRLRGEP
jgi:hypothetical protein